MDVGSAFPVDAESLGAGAAGDGGLHDPAVGAQAGAMPGAAAGDGGRDVAGTRSGRDRCRGRSRGPRTASPALGAVARADREWPGSRRSAAEAGVTPLRSPSGENDGQRCAVTAGDQVAFRARSTPVDRRGACAEPP